MTQSPPKLQAQTVPAPQEQSPPQPSESKPPSKHSHKIYLLAAIGVAIAGVGLSSWYFLSRPKTNNLQISGRIEGYETDIGARVPGRIAEIAVREGDAVKAGQLIVRLNDEEIQAQLRGVQARLAAGSTARASSPPTNSGG